MNTKTGKSLVNGQFRIGMGKWQMPSPEVQKAIQEKSPDAKRMLGEQISNQFFKELDEGLERSNARELH